ncbi:hypothetical protein ANCCEY_06075 [Ancylostoma ceylanicum]|uniref:Uncharacterized protein n=1 Tax=Ancylostoma ceylanicum TaxID=53326 RepID=A0A0D6LXM8_9BILA|nr:hypothetical protein ANCCEY_06075 [Ancylostoma ceylanicum]
MATNTIESEPAKYSLSVYTADNKRSSIGEAIRCYGLLALPDGVYTVEPIYDPQAEDKERQTRSRRSANSWDHYVEVASIYRHQSLRASINVVVVKIIILKHENISVRLILKGLFVV